jgi:hypothetical protein
MDHVSQEQQYFQGSSPNWIVPMAGRAVFGLDLDADPPAWRREIFDAKGNYQHALPISLVAIFQVCVIKDHCPSDMKRVIEETWRGVRECLNRRINPEQLRDDLLEWQRYAAENQVDAMDALPISAEEARTAVLLADLTDISDGIRTRQGELEPDEQKRNELVGRLLDRGVTHAKIAKASGLTRGRVGQIAQRFAPR